MSGRPSSPSPEGRARIHFPPELPISRRVADVAAALERHQVVIVVGATGSGKTTQLPKIALEVGRGTHGFIGVTQPRRIAATSVAARVATELECTLGNEVGYQIRFEDRTHAGTYVKFMTDGILLAEIQSDRLLRRYDTIIIDEAHERSLTIDFLLGWLRRILPERPDLKVMVSSATIESQRFSEFFNGAPVIQVEGRTFPVEVLYEPPPEELDLPEAVARAVANVTSLDPRGDILVFLPGEREIRETEQELSGLALRHTVVQPLYARLSAQDQSKVFASVSERRVILATNVAETSLTLPGIVYVIDAGLARLSRYDSRTGTTRLMIEAISQASADQRKGRCGRVRDGICVRLYDEQSFQARPAFTDPEIKRTGLSGVILRMKSLDLGDVEEFAFLDPPHGRAIAEGYRVLQELGALGADRELTPLGAQLARFPVDPRIGRMILAGAESGCLAQILVVAAALNIQDPRERPRGSEHKADQQQQRFRDERSDFMGILRLWDFVREADSKGKSQLRKACKDHYLSFLRVREWSEVHRQLEDVVRELRLANAPPRRGGNKAVAPDAAGAADGYEALHRALLTGLLSKVGLWSPEQRNYVGAKQTRFALHPASALAKKPPAWVMAFELVQTTQLFARTAARIEPEWLEQVGQHLLKRSYSDPRWSEKAARTSIREQATLFGLPVLKDRSVDYAAVDAVDARRLFLEHALVRGEYKSRGAFQQKNQLLLAEVARLRDKARQSDMLADDEALFAFFDRRVPAEVVNGKTFESFREQVEQSQPTALLLTLDDVLTGGEELRPANYPDAVSLHGVELPLSYRFDPTAEDDGITLSIPLVLLPQIEAGELDWTIPGWHEQKLLALLRSLPRATLRELGTLPELARELAGRLLPFRGALLPGMCRALFELRGLDVSPELFRQDTLPPFLRLTCRVLGEHGNVVAQSRDTAELMQRYAPVAREQQRAAMSVKQWERTGLTTWDFDELPAFLTRKVAGTDLRVYPALVDRERSVDLTLLESAAEAERSTRAGVKRLLLIASRRALSDCTQRTPILPLKLRPGAVPRSEQALFTEQVLLRTVEEAFQLRDGALPRTRRAYEDCLANGLPRLASSYRTLAESIAATSVELDQTVRALGAAALQPSGKNAIADMRSQLEQLFPADLLASVDVPRLAQFPRYLRAVRTRLARALTDPRKDAEKLAPFSPVWTAFLAERRALRDPTAATALRWAFEELRVAIFAPELKPTVAVSVGSLSRALSALR